MISLFFMLAQLNLTPYFTAALNTTQSSALLANILTLFVGLMLIIDFSMEAEAKRTGDESYDNNIGRLVVSGIIVIVNLSVLAIPTTIAVLQSNIINKALNFLSFKKEENIEDEDQESIDSEPELSVDTLSQPVDSSVQYLFPLPKRIAMSSGDVSSPCYLPENLALNSVDPAQNSEFESNQEVQSCKAAVVDKSDILEEIDTNCLMYVSENSITEGNVSPAAPSNPQYNINSEQAGLNSTSIPYGCVKFDASLCFADYTIGSKEKDIPLSDSGSVHRHEEQHVPTPSKDNFIEAVADTAPRQIPVSELQSLKNAESRSVSGVEDDLARQFEAGFQLNPEVVLQQATIEARRLVAEGLAETNQISAPGENYF